MIRLPGIRFIAILFAALFLLSQGLAFAHDVEHGIDHDHEGVACSVSVLGEDDVDVPTPSVTETVLIPFEQDRTPTGSNAVEFQSAHASRAPPPRAPPSRL